MIRSAKDLPPDQRLVLENLIGQHLSDQDNISVQRLAPSTHLTAERRREIAEGLRVHFAQVDAQRRSMSDKEAEQAIDDAIRAVKPRYRPIA